MRWRVDEHSTFERARSVRVLLGVTAARTYAREEAIWWRGRSASRAGNRQPEFIEANGAHRMKSELDKFYALIDEISVAMMTTRRRDGHLESRAMANQKRAPGADLWFVTAADTAKVRDIEYDPHVNLAYYKEGS